MKIWKLKISMFTTLALIIGLSTLFGVFLMNLLGVTNLYFLLGFVIIFNFIQWLIAPYIVDLVYRVKPLSYNEAPELHEVVKDLSHKSGIKTPKLMIAETNIPNAFAYGSPLTGYRVAVTRGLLQTLNMDEVEAVLGHEIGHLTHRDAQTMMFVSVLPSIFYYIGMTLLYSSMFSDSREGEEAGALTMAIGAVSYVFYWILTLFVLYFSRLREYYADRHSVQVVHNGAEKLSTALAKIVNTTSNLKSYSRNKGGVHAFKTLFITDPDTSIKDSAYIKASNLRREWGAVEEIVSRKLTWLDKVSEMFSTHPNIVKRLRTLQQYIH